MLEQSKFLVSFDCQNEKFCEELIILTSMAMALVVMAFPTNKFQPKTVWEHYCKYTLHIHPSQATEDQYDYFLDCWSGDDEYQYLYDYYEKKNTQSITKN